MGKYTYIKMADRIQVKLKYTKKSVCSEHDPLNDYMLF